jgi:hypothetical protein
MDADASAVAPDGGTVDDNDGAVLDGVTDAEVATCVKVRKQASLAPVEPCCATIAHLRCCAASLQVLAALGKQNSGLTSDKRYRDVRKCLPPVIKQFEAMRFDGQSKDAYVEQLKKERRVQGDKVASPSCVPRFCRRFCAYAFASSRVSVYAGSTSACRKHACAEAF